MTSFVIISTDYLLSRWPFLTVRSSVKSTLSWRASGTLMRTSTKNIGSVSHSHLISTQIRVIRTVWSQIDQMLIFRASFLHSTSMPRPSTLTHLTTRSWIGRITCSCGGKNIFLSQITQLRFGWCLKNIPKVWSFHKHPYRTDPVLAKDHSCGSFSYTPLVTNYHNDCSQNIKPNKKWKYFPK